MSAETGKVATEEQFPLTPDSGVGGITPSVSDEELKKMHEEWKTELKKTEDEIETLRQVLASKIRHAHDLKVKLGITVWKEFSDDVNQGIKNITDTETYQKVSGAAKGAKETVGGVFGGLGASIGGKFESLKQTEAFQSVSEKVGGAVSTVKDMAVNKPGEEGGAPAAAPK